MNDVNMSWGIVVLATVAVVALVAVVLARRGRQKRLALARRFGSEYERTRAQYGTRVADGMLAERAKRVERYKVRELSAQDRARFSAAWAAVQAQFVDDPRGAATRAGALVAEVMRARGYDATGGFEKRAEDLSVDHPDVVQHYRAAHALRSGDPSAMNTEDLRQAFVHYRVIFADLLQPSSQTYPTSLMPAHT